MIYIRFHYCILILFSYLIPESPQNKTLRSDKIYTWTQSGRFIQSNLYNNRIKSAHESRLVDLFKVTVFKDRIKSVQESNLVGIVEVIVFFEYVL